MNTVTKGNREREPENGTKKSKQYTPIACGETKWQKREENTMRIMGYVIQAKY